MIAIASNSEVLKKRIIRFFLSSDRKDILNFITELSKCGEVLAFGGLLRDIALYGAKKFNSDIDLVVDCTPIQLASFFSGLNVTFSVNKFDGYRADIGGWSVDVWPVRETWAFKHGGVKYIDRNSLLLTTVTTWESILFSFKDKKVIASAEYFECLRSGELDVVLTANPNEIGVFMRVIKSICDKRARVLMPRALKYIKNELMRWPLDFVVESQKSAFGMVYLTEKDLKKFRNDILSLNEDLFGSFVFVKGENFSLLF